MATFTGTSGNDRLPPAGTDTSGSDSLYGLGGSDTLNGAAGADRMVGGAGDDIYFVDNIGDVVREDPSSINNGDFVESTISYTLPPTIEALRLNLGGVANLNGTGNSVDNSIWGSDGANSLKGLGGNDTLQGGAGVDHLDGGLGVDTAFYAAPTARVDVRLTQTAQVSVSHGDAQGDEL